MSGQSTDAPIRSIFLGVSSTCASATLVQCVEFVLNADTLRVISEASGLCNERSYSEVAAWAMVGLSGAEGSRQAMWRLIVQAEQFWLEHRCGDCAGSACSSTPCVEILPMLVALAEPAPVRGFMRYAGNLVKGHDVNDARDIVHWLQHERPRPDAERDPMDARCLPIEPAGVEAGSA